MNFQPKALLFALGTALAFSAPLAASAQVGVNIQLGHPTWGPAVPQGSQYYYVPEIDGYYDLQARNYIVQRNGQWARMASVPGYNTANFHPVVVNYRGRQPWDQYKDHHTRYYRQPAPPKGNPGRGHDDHGRGHDDHGHR